MDLTCFILRYLGSSRTQVKSLMLSKLAKELSLYKSWDRPVIVEFLGDDDISTGPLFAFRS